MPTIEEARQEIASLVAKYQSLDEKAVRKYTEADTRRVFVLPLFKALGWDVYSREEVSEEERASGGRVDYAFKLRGVSQFYLEAKALRADLNKLEYAKQVITYAYNKGVTWAVLTDFEALKVFNAQTGHLCLNLSCRDYPTDFGELWLLSRESFEKNALNEWAEKHGVLPPRLGIEQRLYDQLRQWREELYTQLYHYNRHLTFDQIDEVIQRLFNRLIFIRTSEDRGIEERVLLSALHQWRSGGRKGELIEVLHQIFRNFDGYYDSDLFLLHLTDQIFVESTTIEGIINGLYDVPGTMASYDFSVIDADVLGAVYEQYLGHVATVVKQRVKEAQARMDLGFPSEPIFEVTAKRQRRKEQGIYYTPRFVTDYIVKETVGRFLQERSYDEVCKIKILDPACGSGSFLIRAYDELLNYHADIRGKAVSELDQWERLPILTGNIFGVDLDIQAVEIARLNLLLRSLARREVLPSLASNICQGNSLISGTEEELRPYFGDAWREKKPFNWEQEFKDIMAQGGFDVVIGNPPYGIVFDNPTKTYLEEEYPTFKRNNDVFVAFIQKAIQLLKNGGLFSFIIPNTFLIGPYFDGIKEYILEQTKIVKRLDFGINQVFPQPNVFNAILVLQKEEDAKKRHDNIVELIDALAIDITQPENLQVETRPQHELSDLRWQSIRKIAAKVSKIEPKLGTIAFVKDVGVNYWTIGRGKTRGGSIADRILYDGTRQNEQDLPFLKGRDIERYQCEFRNRWLRHNYQELLNPKYDVFRYSPEFLLQGPKIIYRQTADRIVATIDMENYLIDKTLHCIVVQDTYLSLFNLKYILGILNSKLATYVYRDLAREEGRLFAQVKTFNMKRIPICRIDFDNPVEKKTHDDLVTLVERMLELNKRLAPIRTTPCNERDELLHEIEHTDQEIDNLVYDLYGLTEEERKIVEGV